VNRSKSNTFIRQAVVSATCALDPGTTPADAEWGERYFHLTDPDGHEISFARPLRN